MDPVAITAAATAAEMLISFGIQKYQEAQAKAAEANIPLPPLSAILAKADTNFALVAKNAQAELDAVK